MAPSLTDIDAHEQPSEGMRGVWKRVSRTEVVDIAENLVVDDPRDQVEQFRVSGTIPRERIARAYKELSAELGSLEIKDASIYHHPILPGLLIIPSILPPEVQRCLLSRMLHRDLSNSQHKTNLHLHYELPYPESPGGTGSFFSYPPDSDVRFQPKDPSVHKPLSMKQVMERRLHWTTFGGQYDWTNRKYPGERPPEFPPDLATFLHTLFPETTPQAAIVNLYTPGDTMMMHRDVSEHSDRGLVSLSIGCDGLFMIAPSDFGRQEDDGSATTNDGEGAEKKYLLLRLRSGDIIYMTEEARTAWHGVPKVVKGTCPEYLADWPAEGDEYGEWRGWMKNKRINLNVRQVHD